MVQAIVEPTAEHETIHSAVRSTLTRLSQAGVLPALPGAATAALAIVRDPDGDVADLINALQSDVGLTTRVLRAANSPLYGRQRIREAVGWQDAASAPCRPRAC